MRTPFQLLCPAALKPREAHCTSVMDRGTGAGQEKEADKERPGEKKGIKEDRAEWKWSIALCSDETESLWRQMCLAMLSEGESSRKRKNPTVTSNAEEAILQAVAKATGLALTSGTPPHPPRLPPNLSNLQQCTVNSWHLWDLLPSTPPLIHV